MKIYFLALACLVSVCNSYAQVNLVKNPSLEDHWRIPVVLDEITFANYWSAIDTLHTYPAMGDTFSNGDCAPEYVSALATSGYCRVPIGGYYRHYCRTGNGMAQVLMYYDNYAGVASFQRDYLQGRLYEQLTVGQSYCVTFYVVLAQGSAYAINSIGAYLDDGSIDTNSNCGFPHMEDVPQVIDTSIINDTLNWTKIQGSFIANGTEKFITIGNFHDTANTSKIVLGIGPGAHHTWYLVDDISVIKSSEVATAGADKSIVLGDTAWIGIDSNGDGMPCYWYTLGNTSPIDSGGRIGVHPSSTTSYVVVMDLCGNVTTDTVTVTVHPAGIGHVPKFSDLKIYPNPATSTVNIEHARGTQMRLYDVLGRAVNIVTTNAGTISIDTEFETIRLDLLSKGVYIAEFIDLATHQKSLRKIVKE